ncbi:hypothetical protein SDC9_77664 [bioreactor metagenome]|uniref:Uncharacterized protein n=1 Tax=bioreactor metagenome TaxID=1076179 RepID=A0A644YTA5_9ZZZZ
MEFSEIAKLTVKKDSDYNSMAVCDIVSRLKQEEPKSKEYYKRIKKRKKEKGNN